MAINIRATVSCSLGTLISGSINDDYIQGTGLVKSRGSVELSGLVTPTIGTAVEFSYTRGGVTTYLPRKLRVLSSFADPYRRTTKVELGCKLTYLAGQKPAIKWNALDDPANSGLTEADARIVTLPFYAASLMDECLAQLGIQASANPLSNRFSVAEFDFSAGYVEILSQLLVSESHLGYLDRQEVLQVISLDAMGGTGPVVTQGHIVDLSSIGQGQLPGESVTVSYSTLKLIKPQDDNQDQQQQEDYEKQINWEREVTIGDPATVQIENPFYDSNPFPFQVPQYFEYKYIPKTITETSYDTLDRVAERKTTEYTIRAVIAPSYVQHIAGQAPVLGPASGLDEFTTVTVESYEYKVKAPFTRPKGDPPDGYDEITERRTVVKDPAIKMAASTQIYELAGDDNVTFSRFSTNTDRYISSKVIERYEYGQLYDGQKCNKVIAETYGPAGTTIRGQQALATGLTKNRGNAAFFNTIAPNALLAAMRLERLNVQTRISLGRGVGLEQRPSAAERTNAYHADTKEAESGDPSNGYRTESKAELTLALGSATAERRIELSVPYVSDDLFIKSGTTYIAIPSDADSKARKFGRVQNRLLAGNRSGMSLQCAAGTLPAAPFGAFVVQANGLSALYRTNGSGWTFDANGIIHSTDALFWGAVGGTGAFWFPVAPGITTLPTTPAVVNGQMTVPAVVPIWNETVELVGRVRSSALITSFPYALTLPDVVLTARVRSTATVRRVVSVDLPSTALAIAGQAPGLQLELRLPVTTLAVTALAPGVAQAGVNTPLPLTTLMIEALEPEVITIGVVDLPLATLTIEALAPTVQAVEPGEFFSSWSAQNAPWVDSPLDESWWGS